MPQVELRGVIYDYRDVFVLEQDVGDGGAEGGCSHVHVNCPEGAPYEQQKRATVRTLSNGFLCSGVIINNTQNDQTPYLYTANHCGQGGNVVVRFNYQTPGCGSGTAPTNQSVSGGVLLANDVDTDGRFMRLNTAIPESYAPYYSGWSRESSDASLSFGLSMHHPGGTPKKLSIDTNGGFKTTGNCQGIGPVKAWSLTFQIGFTDNGSSGGPLWDQDNRLRGTLTGGPSQCNVSLYGRFHDFWNETDLPDWLDPLNSGVTAIDGFDPFADLTPATASNLSPATGFEGSFSVVTITGSGFDGTSSVTFGGVPAVAFDVIGVGNSIVVTAAPGTAGQTVDVVVTDGFGSSTLSNAFTYVVNPAPFVSSVSPASGDVGGGTVVTVSGGSVVGVTEVRFGGVPGTNLAIIDAQTLEVAVPPSASIGPVDVAVLGDGSDLIPGGFTFVNPGSFQSIEPGLAGTLGVPHLQGYGDLLPGGSGFTLTTTGVLGSTFGVLFVSASQASIPFYGGTFYPFPIDLQLGVVSNFFGTVTLPVQLDASIPEGLKIVIQQGFVDAGAIFGVSLSNGMRIRLAED